MVHKFEVKNKNKLDNEWRREKLPPFPTLEKLGLGIGDTVADIGCGIGYFTIPAAEIVEASNKVYALDIQSEMLEEVERRVELAGVSNVVCIHAKEYGLILFEEAVSFALMVNVLHEIEDKPRFLEETRRILKHSGRIAILEWAKKEMEMGPPVDHRLSESEVDSLLHSCGFEAEKRLNFADYFYGIVAVKK